MAILSQFQRVKRMIDPTGSANGRLEFAIMTSKEGKATHNQNGEDSPKSPPVVSVPINLSLPFAVMGGTTQYYLVSREQIENLRIGTDLGESKMYGLSVGVCLTVGGLLIPIYHNHQTATRLISFLWAALFAFAAFAFYFYKKDKKLKAKRESEFNEILAARQTISVPPAVPTESQMPDTGEKTLFRRAQVPRHPSAR